MANNSVPYLCGGIFFTLLKQVKNTGSARDKVNNTYVGVSDPELMARLLYVITNTSPDTFTGAGGFSKDVSKYKNCTFNGGKNIPLNQSPIISAFNYEMKTRYISILNRMINFTDSYIKSDDLGSMNWLVKSLVSIIASDSSIDENEEFQISTEQKNITKKELCSCTHFELQAFLLGILHFVLTKPTTNSNGQATFDSLYPDRENHTEGIFNGSVINHISSEITVVNLQKQKDPAANTQQAQEDTSIPEVEIIDEDDTNTTHTRIINQHIDHPTIVNQHGEKNIHIDHVENLKL